MTKQRQAKRLRFIPEALTPAQRRYKRELRQSIQEANAHLAALGWLERIPKQASALAYAFKLCAIAGKMLREQSEQIKPKRPEYAQGGNMSTPEGSEYVLPLKRAPESPESFQARKDRLREVTGRALAFYGPPVVQRGEPNILKPFIP